ncbi:MAG TPA: RNA polymerase sigma factor [Ferruginibacter sp.]|nr:RNA polymerase sigma factor [Ferruginibacter sp.]HMP21008.1 RNA polymerase sigma factor [Ferruginibacter sp.]
MTLTTYIPPADVLVQECINGNAAAYSILYNRYAKAMFNTSLRIVNHTADAEDVLQEAFIDAFARLSHFEGRATFGAWLKQIVINKSISLLKKQQRFFDEQVPEQVADDPSIDESELQYTVENIKKTVQQLPDGYRTVLLLYLFEGYDHDEIADILKVAPSTVRTQYIRAKQKLLQLLKKEEMYEQ